MIFDQNFLKRMSTHKSKEKKLSAPTELAPIKSPKMHGQRSEPSSPDMAKKFSTKDAVNVYAKPLRIIDELVSLTIAKQKTQDSNKKKEGFLSQRTSR